MTGDGDSETDEIVWAVEDAAASNTCQAMKRLVYCCTVSWACCSMMCIVTETSKQYARLVLAALNSQRTASGTRLLGTKRFEAGETAYMNDLDIVHGWTGNRAAMDNVSV
jgi:hypothetical protein